MAVAEAYLYLIASGGESDGELLRLPLLGGESEVLLEEPAEGAQTRSMPGASEGGVCWVKQEYNESIPELQLAALRCLSLRDGRGPRTVTRIESDRITFAVASDGVYWLRPAGDGQTLELVASAL